MSKLPGSPPAGKKDKKEWKQVAVVTMPWWHKTLIAAGLALIPFIIFVLIPYLTRNYIVNTMMLSEELIDNPPEEFNLVATGELPPCYSVSCNGITFPVPRTMVPIHIDPNSIIFRRSPRRIARTLAVTRQKNPPPVNLDSLGVLRVFVPTHPFKYLETCLSANWQPIRLMCKANLISSQGITSRIFRTSFDDDHQAFVFPTKGNSGYVGRIFSYKDEGYTELAFFDETTSVTLRDWANLARELKFHGEDDDPEERLLKGPALVNSIEQAKLGTVPDYSIIETSLNQYFATGSDSWILPVAYVMGRQGYLRELIDMQRQAMSHVRNDEGLRMFWKAILEDVLRSILVIEVEPHQNQNLLLVTCTNKGRISFNRLGLRITMVYPRGGERQFRQTLFQEGTLHAGAVTNLEFPPPEGFTVRGVKAINVTIEEIEIVD